MSLVPWRNKWTQASILVFLLAILNHCNPTNRSGSNPDLPAEQGEDPNKKLPEIGDVIVPTTFRQGLYLGEDPRVHYQNGYYYSVYQVGNLRKMFRSKSLVDRGPGKVIPQGYPLFSPIYIESLNGVRYDAWFAFDINVWRCDCKDPYEEIDKWQRITTMPMTGWSIDFELFQNTQPGPYQNKWYMTWAGAESPNKDWGPESIYIAELLDLRPDKQILSTYDNLMTNSIVRYRFDWTDVIVEAPNVVSKNESVSLIYSGNGAQTNDYALGIAMLIPGEDPTQPTSWIDYNRGGCPEDVRNTPEFAKTNSLWGPGVARIVPSPQGDESWMAFHSKVWSTVNRKPGPQGQQQNNQMWTRQIHLQPIDWQTIRCKEQSYTIPKLDKPIDVGTLMDLPSGDAGFPINREPVRVEAELMLPFGVVMGSAMQQEPLSPSLNLIHASCDQEPNSPIASCSSNKYVQQLPLLAADSTNNPKQSGLTFYNTPIASRLLIATSSEMPAQLDLWKNGTFVQTLSFPASGKGKFIETTFDAAYTLGDTLQLIYVDGKHNAPWIDYVEFLPPAFYDLR